MNKPLSHGHQPNRSSVEGRRIPLGWALLVSDIKEMDIDGQGEVEKSGCMAGGESRLGKS